MLLVGYTCNMMATAPHPELRVHEVFLSNVRRNELHLLDEWKTARTGQRSYDAAGDVITDIDMVPVFVNETEYVEHYGDAYLAANTV